MTQLGGRTSRPARAGRWPALLVAAVLAACGSSGTTAATPTSTTLPFRVLGSRTVDVAGTPRQYGMFVPRSAPAHPPLVVLVHLFVSATPPTGRQGAGDGRSVIEAAGRDGFAVANAQGVDFSFNGGSCCGTAAHQGLDDVGFLDAVIRDAVTRDGVNPRRVYLVGFSNGAFLSYRFACERPDVIAGAAIVEGALLVPSCRPARPVDLLVLHQAGDETVPLEGTAASSIPGDPVPLPSVAASRSEYLQGAGCPTHGTRTVRGGRVETVVACDGRRIESIVLPGGAHRWPTAAGFDAAGTITRFFGLGRS